MLRWIVLDWSHKVRPTKASVGVVEAVLFFPHRFLLAAFLTLGASFDAVEHSDKAVKASETAQNEGESSIEASAEENTSNLSHTANAGIGSSARVSANQEGLTTIKIDEDFDQWTEEKQQDFLKVRLRAAFC